MRTPQHQRFQGVIAAGLIAALLGGCGGGGGGGAAEPVTETAVPASAAATPESWTSYATARVIALFDTAEPLSLDAIGTVPTSETAEPVALP